MPISSITFGMCGMCSPVDCLLTISDSIAIEILDQNTILTGVGNELHLHKNGNETVLENVFLRNKVHGIVKGVGANAGELLVYGEKEFMILNFDNEYQFKQRYRGKLTDWIIAGIFFENEPGFALLTAHSVLLKFVNDARMSDYTLAERVSCEDKSTLYCAHLNGSCWHNLIVFGGNAFGELLIWQPKKAETPSEIGLMKSRLLQRMPAHNGVIFSIEYNSQNQTLISTSDDRSVRFWNVLNSEDWSTALIKPMASGYGHTARVFHGKIFDYGNTSYALTVGEDSFFCLWRCDGELLSKQRHQFGAVIWRLTYDAEQQIIYTVGSTGNMLAFNLRAVLSKSEPGLRKSLALNAVDALEYVAKIKFLTKDQLIGVTNQNRLLVYDLNNENWKSVKPAISFKCTVLEVSEKLIAFCGFKSASVYEFRDEDLKIVWEAEILSSVIRSFHFLSSSQFLMSDDAGNCVLLKYDENTKQKMIHVINLPKGKERWLTAAILLCDTFLLASNRQGNILLYAFDNKNDTFELKHILKHPHGYLGATLLTTMELNEKNAYVQSAGHDSTLKILKVDFIEAVVSIQNREHTPVAWIETSIALSTCSRAHLGFNDNHFVVWCSQHDISLQIECGGGHRCWHFFNYDAVLSRKQRIRLAFIKNKKVLLYDYPLCNDHNINYANRWHTRPCNVMEVIENPTYNESIIISAGDDNLIKVSTLAEGPCGAKLKQLAEIQTHISNIRALKVLCTSPTKCLIFSGGGRAQLCLTELELVKYRVCEIFDVTLKTVENSPAKKKQEHSFDPETRIMSIDVLQQETQNNTSFQHFEIYAACSDGYIRKFKANNASMQRLQHDFQLEKSAFYGKCLLQIRLVANTFLLTAATDGYVTFYDLNIEQTLLKLHLHASGINALDINYNCETKLLRLLTGGDDQAVVFTKICFKNLSTPFLIEKLELPQLHTAQVTGAKLTADGLCFYTSGVDQNLVQFDLEAKKILSVKHGCVADVKGLTLCLTKNICLVYGCGLQIFR